MKYFFFSFILGLPALGVAQIINTEYGPTHYYSAADSPFYAGIQAGTIYLEDFEDGQLNTPYVTSADFPLNPWRGVSTKSIDPTGYTYSVDGDDGLLGDFRGGNGNSWSSTSNSGGYNRHEFLFSPNEFGQYPTYVGFVVTLVGDVDSDVEFLAFSSDFDVFTGYRVIYSSDSHDPATFVSRPYESTTNHRFLGLHSSEGIHRLYIDNVDELDHLQYGYSIAGVPEPSTYALMGLGLSVIAFTLCRRKRG